MMYNIKGGMYRYPYVDNQDRNQTYLAVDFLFLLLNIFSLFLMIASSTSPLLTFGGDGFGEGVLLVTAGSGLFSTVHQIIDTNR